MKRENKKDQKPNKMFELMEGDDSVMKRSRRRPEERRKARVVNVRGSGTRVLCNVRLSPNRCT